MPPPTAPAHSIPSEARAEDQPPELADHLRVLRRRWAWTALSLVLVVAAAAALTLRQPPRYTASALVSLGSSAAQDAFDGAQVANDRAATRELSNEVNLAMSDTVRDEVVAQLGYQPSVTITAETEADALRFRASAPTAQQAADDANTWARVYVNTKRRDAADSIDDAIDAFEADLTELRTERQELRQPIDEANQAVAAADDEGRPAAEAEVARLEADLATELTLVDARLEAVAQSITNLELSGQLATTGTAVVVQVAAPPLEPSNTPLARNLALAAVTGLIIGAGAALLVENLDRTIKTSDDLVALGLPVLGEIPTPNRQLPKSELALATMLHTGTPVAEAYQKVRTAVEFALLGQRVSSLLVTSANEEEGKTTLSANLAWALSAVGHRVALIDVDFRRPRIHQVYGCNPQPGLSDSLASGLPLADVALRVDEHRNSNFIVIPTGTKPPNPADFVASPTFASQVKAIEAEADLVVLDAPPVLPVSDALSLGRQADAVILVARCGKTTRDQLARALDSLTQAGAEVIGACLVGVKGSTTYGQYVTKPENTRSKPAAPKSGPVPNGSASPNGQALPTVHPVPNRAIGGNGVLGADGLTTQRRWNGTHQVVSTQVTAGHPVIDVRERPGPSGLPSASPPTQSVFVER